MLNRERDIPSVIHWPKKSVSASKPRQTLCVDLAKPYVEGPSNKRSEKLDNSIELLKGKYQLSISSRECSLKIVWFYFVSFRIVMLKHL